MTPYRIAVVDDLERDRAWLAEKLADYMARDRLESETLCARASPSTAPTTSSSR